MVDAYATALDVEDRWRPLTEVETRLANTLAVDASVRVRRRFPTIDARIASGSVDPLEVTAVVAGMVKRAMIAPEGVSLHTQVGGPYQDTKRYANPLGDLYLTADDLAVLSEGGMSRRAFSVDLTPQPVTIVLP